MANAPRIGVLNISDRASAGVYEDTPGKACVALLREWLATGFEVDYRVIPDEQPLIEAELRRLADESGCCLVVTTGGTGPAPRDVTPEALDRVKTKEIPGFGELFRWLSFASIGTSTIQSRACAVLARGTYIFALPGSNGAVKDGWDQILVHQLDSRHRPCNFVELMPRLREV